MSKKETEFDRFDRMKKLQRENELKKVQTSHSKKADPKKTKSFSQTKKWNWNPCKADDETYM